MIWIGALRCSLVVVVGGLGEVDDRAQRQRELAELVGIDDRFGLRRIELERRDGGVGEDLRLADRLRRVAVVGAPVLPVSPSRVLIASTRTLERSVSEIWPLGRAAGQDDIDMVVGDDEAARGGSARRPRSRRRACPCRARR